MRRRNFALAGLGSLLLGCLIGAHAEEQTLSDKAISIKQRLALATSLQDVVALSTEWNTKFDTSIQNVPKSRDGRDREKIKATIAKTVATTAFVKFLADTFPAIESLVERTRFLTPLLLLFKSYSPSVTVDTYTEYTQLDIDVQKSIRDSASQFLPADWQSSMLSELKMLDQDLNKNLLP